MFFAPLAGSVPGYATAPALLYVATLMVRELYRRFGERWLLEALFDDLLTWNRWWAERRSRAVGPAR